ncbi:iron ABC transporter permease [Vibrio sp. SS-MA-C1-2]|uniref:FecCD family ABC transporter permease n=1 Tax=Vibrio sp. SS-MA-C1-2 TaxID=2908646 RepID=UPI001F3586ED|nr:iron ABC transporter permease [Vibrio sp. SS-MA-C1-2]UJF18740.1 iron ABC transporter permease [Vibrio sp. SS-MA-C1-2]
MLKNARHSHQFFTYITTFLVVLLIAVTLFSALNGRVTVSVSDYFSYLLGHKDALSLQHQFIIHQIRLPRTLLCLITGAILALCGAIMQGLFRNPLADPGIIGVSSGATLGAAVAIVLIAQLQVTLTETSELLVKPFFAFAGGAISTLVVYRLGTKKQKTSVMAMLLAGIAITAITGAGVSFLSYISDSSALRELSLWSMGSFSGAQWQQVGLALTVLVVIFIVAQYQSRGLNAMLLGENEAAHLGLSVQFIKRLLILITAIGVGTTVSFCGIIAFIGLVVPHIARMIVGVDHKKLLPVSTLLGAILLLLADLLSRVILTNSELPVGIVTSLIGAPFFLYLLTRQREAFI